MAIASFAKAVTPSGVTVPAMRTKTHCGPTRLVLRQFREFKLPYTSLKRKF
jgi:hypothetical protein